MPPSAHEFHHYKQVVDAYKAKLRNAVSTHKKRITSAMSEVDVRKAHAMKAALARKKKG